MVSFDCCATTISTTYQVLYKMPNHLLSRQKTGHRSSRLTKVGKNVAAMSAWVCLASTSTSAFSTKGYMAFRTSLLRRPPACKGLSFISKKHQNCNSQSFLSTHDGKPSELAVSTQTETVSYDVLNKRNGLDKYDPGCFEAPIYRWWESVGCFEPDSKQKKREGEPKPYVIPMPPPNVTGRLHMGHAIFVALQDVLARFHRMRGRPVLWLPGRSLL